MTDKPAASSRMYKMIRNTVAIVLLLLAFFFGRSLFFKREQTKRMEAGVDDRNISYLAFNEENKKSIEVKCQASFTKGDDELHLKGISAVIYKSGRMNKDIQFFGDQGVAKDDFNHFQIQGNARIVSEGFTVRAEHFLMTSKKNLVSKEKTLFSGENISGTAAAGIEFLFGLNEYKFFGVQGTVSSNKQKFDFASRMMWIFKENDRLELKGESSIRTADSLLSGDEIIMRFGNAFTQLQSYISLRNSTLHSEKNIPGGPEGNREILEVSANTIESIFDENGNLERMMIFDNGRLEVGSNSNRCEISGDNIDCRLFPQTQTISEIFIRTPGEIKSRGSQNVELSAEQIAFQYDETGIMEQIHAEKNVRFLCGDFNGSAPELKLDAKNNKLVIEGEEAKIKTGANLFAGSFFVIDTKKNQLSAPSGVKATVFLEKGSVLFHAAPLYLSADNLQIGDNGRNSTFKNKVKLFQDEIMLTAGEINFNNKDKAITARGQVYLKFVNEKDVVVLEGRNVIFDSSRRQIAAVGNAQLRQIGNTLKAGKIILILSRDERLQNISAQQAVEFANDKISGKSELLSWQFEKKDLVFKKEAQISKKNSGMTRGQELHFNLESNEITVSGADDRSETTILHDRP